MIDIIHIYKHKEIFHKNTYTSENRKVLNSVERFFESENGYLDNGNLYLPIEFKSRPDLDTADLIIIQDIKNRDPFLTNKAEEQTGLSGEFIKSKRDFSIADNQTHFEFRNMNSPKFFEIFSISKSVKNSFELSMIYNQLSIGIPERKSHKICDLKLKHPVRYKINGKSDFTMTGRKQRTFYEYDYVIEWIGQADKIIFQELNKIKKTKEIHLDKCKLIDERKILY